MWQLGQNLQALLIKLMLRGPGSDIVSLKSVKVISIVGEAPLLDKVLARYIASLRSAPQLRLQPGGGCQRHMTHKLHELGGLSHSGPRPRSHLPLGLTSPAQHHSWNRHGHRDDG